MGTVYYGVCHDCKQYIELDKFGAWGTLPMPGDDYSDEKTDEWVFKTLRLQAFIYKHNGHKIGIYAEADFDFLSEDGVDLFKEQDPWPVKEFLSINKKTNNLKKRFDIYVSNIARKLHIFLLKNN